MDAPIIAMEGIGLTFPQSNGAYVRVLSDIDLTVPSGEVLCFVGPSGCGKTSLLRLISGLVPPTRGRVRVAGLSPVGYTQKHGIGFVFQRSLLFPWRTVLENVVLPAEIRGADAIEARGKARSLLDELGLGGFEDGYPWQLSGGMLQRAALARALLTNPGILLLDEPFSALDETTREQIWTDFNQFWRGHGLTVVLVTHSIREAAFLSDRVITLSPRPARVVSEIRIPLGSERVHRITLTPEFTSICEAIRNAVPMS